MQPRSHGTGALATAHNCSTEHQGKHSGVGGQEKLALSFSAAEQLARGSQHAQNSVQNALLLLSRCGARLVLLLKSA